LDETRPYIMQYAAACWLTAALLRLTANPPASALDGTPIDQTPHPLLPKSATAILAAATVVMLASSILGVIWAGAFVLAFAILVVPGRSTRPAKQPALWLAGIVTLVLFLGFAAYYIATWQAAGRGYNRGGLSLLSIPFIAYEFLGFSGFGPGKLQLRVDPTGSLWRSAPALLPLAAILSALGLLALRQLRPRAWNKLAVTAWALALGLPTLAIFAAMFLFDHRALPRHFIPALPALLLVLAALLQLALRQKSVFWRAIAVLLPILWMASAFNLRWRPSHAKDDYRTASKVAAAALAANQEVWWAADAAAAYVYLTPVALEEVPGRAWAMQAPSWNDIRFKFPPRVIVISKPDIYDPQSAIARYASENRFVPALELQAFTIFTREGEELPAVQP
jgi:hypothetical protein